MRLQWRKLTFAILAGIIASFCFVAGQRLDTDFSIDLSSLKFYGEWILLAIVLSVVIHMLWENFLKIGDASVIKRVKQTEIYRKIDIFVNRLSFAQMSIMDPGMARHFSGCIFL